MATSYHPPQRAIAADILTAARWIRATIHVPRAHALDDHLAKGHAFVTLTDVRAGRDERMPFLALRASSILVVAPLAPERDLKLRPVPGAVPVAVRCYLESLLVRGRLELLPDVRVSDFLAHHEGYLVVRDASLSPPAPDGLEPAPIALVNAAAVVAVAEEPEERVRLEAEPAH